MSDNLYFPGNTISTRTNSLTKSGDYKSSRGGGFRLFTSRLTQSDFIHETLITAYDSRGMTPPYLLKNSRHSNSLWASAYLIVRNK